MVLETSSGVGDAAPELRAGAGELLLWPGLAIGWLVQTGGGCLERLSPPRLEKDMARALAVRPEHVRFFLCLFAGALLTSLTTFRMWAPRIRPYTLIIGLKHRPKQEIIFIGGMFKLRFKFSESYLG